MNQTGTVGCTLNYSGGSSIVVGRYRRVFPPPTPATGSNSFIFACIFAEK